jgi:hypothetical protein
MRRERRGPWYLLTGLVIGAVIGLGYSWLVQPVEYTNTSPASLREDFKDQYRALIASAYAANGDLVRARARLNLLGDADVYDRLAEQAQRTLADGSAPFEARALGLLAVALEQPPGTGAPGSAVQITPSPGGTSNPSSSASLTPSANPTLTETTSDPSAIQEITATLQITATSSLTATTSITATVLPSRTPRPTRTSTATATPLPSRTPTPTQGAPFELDAATQVCDPDIAEALIQIEALDAAGQPVPAVQVQVEWPVETGIAANTFSTGLKPEISPGYADFSMTPGIVYSVRIVPNGAPVGEISAFECERRDGERYWGGWQLVFVQP